MKDLTWGLVIATKDRLEALKICVTLAVQQSLPPIEVVVADSSADWDIHAQEIKAIIDRDMPGLRLVYEQGVAPSLTMQRNQAVARAHADIVFMIDDDSFLYPDAAEEIMKIYEADTEEAVAGIQTTLAAHRPDVVTQEAQKDVMDVGPMLQQAGVRKWLLSNVLLLSSDKSFHPYEGAYPDLPIPDAVRGFNVARARLFGGCRMTYRRKVVLKEPFEPLLRYYCPAEDLDGSYRISRHGCLLTAKNARMHHYISASGRLNRYQVVTLLHLNNALFFRKNIADQRGARRLYRNRMMRRVLAEFLKDLLTREVRMPRTRGILRAWTRAGEIFALPEAALQQRYPVLQDEIVKA